MCSGFPRPSGHRLLTSILRSHWEPVPLPETLNKCVEGGPYGDYRPEVGGADSDVRVTGPGALCVI